MALSSTLFRGNRALQACAVQDSAHVTPGARGEHVGKIQFALFAVDGLRIDRTELAQQRYGPSTAAAVLAYKKKRQIINRSYQNAADDIVGKMTIASLDKDIRRQELLPKPPGDCALSPPGGAGVPILGGSASRRSLALAGSRTANVTAPRQFNGLVRVFFQITLRAAMENGYPLSANIERARDCLFEHGITLSVEFRNGFADTLQFSEPVLNSFGSVGDNVDQLRTISENARPGVPGVFRVIVCQMVGDSAGETFRNRRVGGRIVPPFALLNSQIIDRAHSTLIHEMIHASNNGPVRHDDNPASVFFDHGSEKPGNIDRTVLPSKHAETLATLSSKL